VPIGAAAARAITPFCFPSAFLPSFFLLLPLYSSRSIPA
jgi:hypothetical protein